jgi:hypothetical protein
MDTKTQNHEHTGTDSKKLTGRSFFNSPQSSLTTKDTGVFTTGGANNLKTADATILDNMRTRINELELRLQALQFLR